MSDSRIPCVLSLGGSFNPIHTQHVVLMELLKNYLESTYSNIRVVGGILVPSTYGWISGKLHDDSQIIKDNHRMEMVRLAITTRSGDFSLFCTEEASVSGWHAANKLIPTILKRNGYSKDSTVLHAQVVGQDKVRGKDFWWYEDGEGNYRRRHKSPTGIVGMVVAVGREESSWRKLSDMWKADFARGNVFVDNGIPMQIASPICCKDISSTMVRQVFSQAHSISAEERRELFQNELVSTDLIDSRVAEYLLEHWTDLFVGEKGSDVDKEKGGEHRGGNGAAAAATRPKGIVSWLRFRK